MVPAPSQLKARIVERIAAKAPFGVWTPVDFLDLGDRDAVDKSLQRLARAGTIRRIAHGLYDQPRVNRLTGSPTVPDYRRVLEALARRDNTRMLVDGLTAANDLGLTDAVPGRVVVHTDTRRRSIHLGNLIIEFKKTAPSRLYWADRPAMRVVQALHWLKDTLPGEQDRVTSQLRRLLEDRDHGPALRNDLRAGLPMVPAWMQPIVRQVIDDSTPLDRGGPGHAPHGGPKLHARAVRLRGGAPRRRAGP